MNIKCHLPFGPWWWSSDQRIQRSEFESCWRLFFRIIHFCDIANFINALELKITMLAGKLSSLYLNLRSQSVFKIVNRAPKRAAQYNDTTPSKWGIGLCDCEISSEIDDVTRMFPLMTSQKNVLGKTFFDQTWVCLKSFLTFHSTISTLKEVMKLETC